MGRHGTDSSGSGHGLVADACECVNENSGSIKCGEFLEYLDDLLASQEGFCSTELV